MRAAYLIVLAPPNKFATLYISDVKHDIYLKHNYATIVPVGYYVFIAVCFSVGEISQKGFDRFCGLFVIISAKTGCSCYSPCTLVTPFYIPNGNVHVTVATRVTAGIVTKIVV